LSPLVRVYRFGYHAVMNLDGDLPIDIYRHTSDAPNVQGVVILRDDKGKLLSPHLASSIQSFLIWLNGGHGTCKYQYSYEMYADLGGAADRCNRIIVRFA